MKNMVLDRVGLKVGDYMTSNPISLGSTNNLKDAVKIMASKKIGNIIINDEHGYPSRIFTEREILGYLVKEGGIPDIEMKNARTQPYAIISTADTILEAARILLTSKRRLLVFESEKLVGIITVSDILRGLRTTGGNPSLDRVICKKVYDCIYHDSIFKTVNLMFKKRIGCVIVNKNNLPFGIFTERDLLGVLTKNIDLQERIEGYTSTPLLTAPIGIKGNDAAEIMSKHKIKRLPLELENKIRGIVTARDIVDAFRSM
jgi:CBS domain-containing protein